MSDSAWVDIFYFDTDEKKIEEIFEYPLDQLGDVEDDIPKVTTRLAISEGSYGCTDEIKKMAKARLTFHGRHGSGGSYGSMCFACLDGDLVECDTNNNGFPVAQVHEGGAVDDRDKERALKYWRLYGTIMEKAHAIEDRLKILSEISG